VLLGIGDIGNRDDAYNGTLWNEVITMVKARRLIAIHWDDFWIHSELPMQPLSAPFDHGDSVRSLQQHA
jgi:hypothetical protein